jgi:hypothetical protein
MYTKKQIRFWVVLAIICCLITFQWFQLFSSPLVKVSSIVAMIFVVTIISAIIHMWKISIIRSKDFKSGTITHRKYPVDVDCWNLAQRGIPMITMLLVMVPVLVAFLLKILL